MKKGFRVSYTNIPQLENLEELKNIDLTKIDQILKIKN